MQLKICDLTWENIDKWPSLIKFIVAGILFISCLMLGYWLDIKQQLTQLVSAKAHEQALKQSYQTKQPLAANYVAYKEQVHTLNKTFANLLYQLPSNTEIHSVLEEISQASITSGLILKMLRPLPEVNHDFYTELPLQLQVIGNYQQLNAFVHKLTSFKHMVALHDFTIRPTDEPNQGLIANQQLIMDIAMQAYHTTKKVKGNP